MMKFWSVFLFILLVFLVGGLAGIGWTGPWTADEMVPSRVHFNTTKKVRTFIKGQSIGVYTDAVEYT